MSHPIDRNQLPGRYPSDGSFESIDIESAVSPGNQVDAGQSGEDSADEQHEQSDDQTTSSGFSTEHTGEVEEYTDDDVEADAGGLEGVTANQLHDQEGFKSPSLIPNGTAGKPSKPRRAINEATSYFKDGRRVIDYILAYSPKAGSSKTQRKNERIRQAFEAILVEHGLELETEHSRGTISGHLNFIKIHASWDFMARAAEFIDVKMPIQEYDIPEKNPGCVAKCMGCFSCRCCTSKLAPFPPDAVRPPKQRYFSMKFERDLEDYFLIKGKETFFSPIQRIRLVSYAMQMITVDPDGKGRRSLTLPDMVRSGVYASDYCLHDSDWHDREYKYHKTDPKDLPLRLYLAQYWATFKAWRWSQPLEQVWQYFGEKIAMYFAFLGYYTVSLVPPAILGVLVVLIGVIQVFVDPTVTETCSEEFSGKTICRLCKKDVCPFTSLGNFCRYARIGTLFDNFVTPLFAFFISLWGVCFLELWKRRQATVASEWDASEEETRGELLRPEFRAKVQRTRINPVTKEEEQYMRGREKILRVLFSTLVMIILYGSVVAVFVGLNLYKQTMVGLLAPQNESGVVKAIGIDMIVSFTASLINLLMIFILSSIFSRIAWWITYLECPRTEDDFEESYIYKRTCFEFVNNYGMLLYLAVFKGKLFTIPHTQGHLIEQCPPVGCMAEITLQLMVILVGKQIIDNGYMEIAWPAMKVQFRKLFFARKGKMEEEDGEQHGKPRWEKDFILEPLVEPSGVDDYLEMVIQYGFITMFAAAFPLAPLFAFLNNIVEIRVDAKQYLMESRRPVPRRTGTIGPWLQILEVFTKIAVVTNAVVIAFTSKFLEKAVYMSIGKYKEVLRLGNQKLGQRIMANGTSLQGFVAWSLSEFHTVHYNEHGLGVANDSRGTIETCWFGGYYETRDDLHVNATLKEPSEFYYRRLEWWILMAFRLIFILVFEHTIIAIQSIISSMIPDVPSQVQLFRDREAYLSRQVLSRPPIVKDEDGSEKGKGSEDSEGHSTELTTDDRSNGEKINTVSQNPNGTAGADGVPRNRRQKQKTKHPQDYGESDVFAAYTHEIDSSSDDDGERHDTRRMLCCFPIVKRESTDPLTGLTRSTRSNVYAQGMKHIMKY